MTEIIRYIIRFMVGEHFTDDISRFVGYTSDCALFADYKVVIVPSGFFDDGIYGTEKTKPSLPLKNIEGVPFLFGTSEIEQVGDTIVIHADLVASAYFLLSRYEEIIHRDIRDEHGRFPGRESLPRRAGFIDRPIVEEYGKLLRKLLNDSGVVNDELSWFIRKINLTHDVDVPFNGRTWRNVVRKVISGINPVDAIRAKYSALEKDPYYTFPWMFKEDKRLLQTVGVDRCQSLMFFRAGGKTKQDKPHYDLRSKDIQTLYSLCKLYGQEVGLHCSYQAGLNPEAIASEKENLENAFGIKITKSRHHFLVSREPEDMEFLEKTGITDDYTIGYADIAGFRLGTSLPVRYINPVTRHLSSLVVHPLVIMDCSLNELKYMNLTSDMALEYCLRLIENTRRVNGELTLLWHNTSAVERSGYLRDLYSKLIRKID